MLVKPRLKCEGCIKPVARRLALFEAKDEYECYAESYVKCFWGLCDLHKSEEHLVSHTINQESRHRYNQAMFKNQVQRAITEANHANIQPQLIKRRSTSYSMRYVRGICIIPSVLMSVIFLIIFVYPLKLFVPVMTEQPRAQRRIL